MPFCFFGLRHFIPAFILLAVSLGYASEPPKAAAPAPTAPPAAKAADLKMTLVTRVVGEAGPRVVTSREVRINEAIGQVLQKPALPDMPATPNVPAASNAVAAKMKVLSVEDPAFPAQVLRVLDEWTVFLEATEVGSKVADKSEVARLTKAVLDHWKGASDWERLETSSGEIREIIERKLAAQSLERLKGDASLVNITDAEALQYYKKNRLRFGNQPFENFKDNIKSALVRSQTERRLAEWRSVLRRKYRVRNFVGA